MMIRMLTADDAGHWIAVRLNWALLLVVALFLQTLTGCDMNANAASKYFSGRYLEAALAIDSNDAEQLTAVSKGLDLNAAGREHMTLLWYAIQKKNYGAIKALIRGGARPDQQAVEKLGTPLYFALTDKDLRVLEAMLDGGLSPDWRDGDGANLLQLAMRSDHAFDAVKLLVARNADVAARDSIGGSALDEAVDAMQPDIAAYLIHHGADVTGHMANGSSTAWAVQQTIARLSPEAKGATTTDFALDKNGQPVAATQTLSAPGTTREGREMLAKFQELRALMIEKGAKFPADSPAKVREQMSHK